MNALVPYNFMGRVDMTDWPKGEWIGEPDMLKWTDPETGYALLIRRGQLGAYCGYVGVQHDHRDFHKHYDKIDVWVHGGLTFSDHIRVGDDFWWFGFDCAHAGDFIPMLASYDYVALCPSFADTQKDSVYRNYAYVVGEIHQLATVLRGRDTFWNRVKDLTGHIWAYVFSLLKRGETR